MRNILIVDDEDSILEITAVILEKNGFTTELARSIEEAKDRLNKGGIDAAIIDVVFPGKGGVELLMQLHEEQSKLPIIIMTGKVRTDSEPFRNLVQHFGAKHIITKPFSSSTLLTAVNDAIGSAPKL